MELSESDLFAILLNPLDHWLIDVLAGAGWSARTLEAAMRLVHAAETIVLVCLLAGGAMAIRRAAARGNGTGSLSRYAVQAVSAGIGVVAAALFIWIVSRPSSDM